MHFARGCACAQWNPLSEALGGADPNQAMPRPTAQRGPFRTCEHGTLQITFKYITLVHACAAMRSTPRTCGRPRVSCFWEQESRMRTPAPLAPVLPLRLGNLPMLLAAARLQKKSSFFRYGECQGALASCRRAGKYPMPVITKPRDIA